MSQIWTRLLCRISIYMLLTNDSQGGATLKYGRFSVGIQVMKDEAMKNFDKVSLVTAAVGTLLAFGAAMPARAAVVLCTGANCVNTDANVLINSGTGSSLTGNYNNSDVDVTFTSTLDTLTSGANGQASVGSLDNLLNQLTFTIENGFGFTSAIFNLEAVSGRAADEAISVFVNYRLADGTISQITQAIGVNGQNFLGITGTNGEIFTSAGFTGNPSNTGIGEFKQLRLGGVAAIGAVPEPTTWVMMLLGMAGIGFSMRRKEKLGLRVRFA